MTAFPPFMSRRQWQSARTGRRGAILTFELLLILPIVLALCLAVVELSLLWSGNQRLALASRAACRVATLPGSTDDDIRQTVLQSLLGHRLGSVVKIEIQRGAIAGDPVGVRLIAPMQAASPDLLAIVGFSLADRQFSVVSIMRQE
ncbi:MAG: pilus assembly protein [Pirellulales bacterium]|nr:pilus assembly protein [Pirellulales bacterium]